MSSSQLLQELPELLRESLNKRLQNGESLVVTLPGAHGEAFILTNKRAMVIRDELPGYGQPGEMQIYPYLISHLTDAVINSSETGGSLVLKTDTPITDQTKVTVFYPSQAQSKFEAAAKLVQELVTLNEDKTVQGDQTINRSSSSNNQGSEAVCSSCGSNVEDHDVFCGSCGFQLLAVCGNCSSPLKKEYEYCTRCGWSREEAVSECPGCGKRAYFGGMTYCADCGHILQVRCSSCGGNVLNSWKYCASCGRDLSSQAITPLSGLPRFRERETADAPKSRTFESASSVESSEGTLSAAGHNARGKQLYDQDRMDEAIDEFVKAVKLEPKNPTYHCNLAVAYDDKDMDDLALAEYEKTLELNPEDVTALLYLGYLYSERENTELALTMWRKVTEIAPGSAEAQEALDCLRHQENL